MSQQPQNPNKRQLTKNDLASLLGKVICTELGDVYGEKVMCDGEEYSVSEVIDALKKIL